MEKDPKIVEKLAEERQDENWEFRSFLKWTDLEEQELDAIVHRINEEVAEQIDCTECGNCCRTAHPELDESDIARLAAGLGLKEQEVIDRYLLPDETEGRYGFNKKPCPLLNGNLCSVYEHRPKDCRSYPHLDKEGFNYRTMQAVANTFVCPIVFNVFERLKDEIWDERTEELEDEWFFD